MSIGLRRRFAIAVDPHAARGAPRRPLTAPFADRLVEWQGVHGRHDLPWQNTRDAYRIWLSEIMLQQTQVTTVIPYFQRFVAAFPDVHALASAPLERVLERWSGLGYYRRAHHLHAAAKVIVTMHGGVFPADTQAIAALPGIGRSTAAAIAAFAHGVRAPILDGNVKRVLARHRGIEGYPGKPEVESALWRSAEAFLPSREVERYTQGLMDLGATICTRTRPRCGECPVAEDCVARIAGRVGELPSPRPKKVLPRRAVQILLIERSGTILLERRPPTGIWAGLWSLPEVPIDGDVGAHCKRLGLDARAIATLSEIEHGFTHFHLTLHPRRVSVRSSAKGVEEPGFAWLAPNRALEAALPAPIRKLVQKEFRA